MEPAPKPRLSPFAVASVALGVLAVPLVPAALGVVALSETQDPAARVRGARLAKAGIVLGILWFLIEGAAAGVYLARPDSLLRWLYRDRIALGESSAPEALRLVARQQEVLKANDMDENGVKDYWTGDIAGLYRLQMARRGRPEIMGPDVANADSASGDGSPAIPRDGYLLRTVPGVNSLVEFAATAFPHVRGEDGFLTFYVDERGVVWKRDIGGAPADHRMEDPAAEGWSRVESR